MKQKSMNLTTTKNFFFLEKNKEEAKHNQNID